MKSFLEQAIGRYLAFVERRSGLVIAVAFALSLAGLLLGQRIEVNPSLEALLPEDAPALPALDELRERVPGSTPLYLLVSSPDAAQNRQLSDTLLSEVKAWPETLYAMNRREPDFFLDRRLLFLPAQELDELAETVEDIVAFEECERLPGCENLDERPETPDRNALRQRISKVPEVRALLGLFGLSELPESNPDGVAQRDGSTSADPSRNTTTKESGKLGLLCSVEGDVCAVHVVLDGSPNNLVFAQAMLDKAEALFAKVRPKDAPSTLQLATSGAYRNAPLTKQVVVDDLRNTAILSTTLMLVLVLAQFRFGRAFVLIFVPLIVAACWSAGIIGLMGAELNVISAFTLAVLAGLGIDFGVHMLTHYGTEREHGHAVPEALRRTFDGLAGPMAVAGVTTACGFGALMAAEFRGFAQMGGLAALGVACALLAFLALFPALAHLCHRWVPESESPVRPWRFRRRALESPRRLAGLIAGGGLLLAIAAGVLGTRVSFEYNFRNLRPKTVGHGIPWTKAMHGTTRSAVVMLADDAAPIERVAAALRAEGGGELVKDDAPWILTAGSFVPPDQDARLAAIARLRESFERGFSRLPPDKRAELAPLEPLLQVREPIRPDALPEWVDRWLRDRDGRFGTFGLLYTDLSGADAREMEMLSGHMERWHARFPDVRFASSVALLGMVIPGLRADGPLMLGLAIAGLLLATSLISRSFGRAVLVLTPLLGAMAITLACMVLLDLRVNLYNMLIFPLAFGIGVDGAVYIAWVMSQREIDWRQLAITVRGVLGSTLTTAAGFGSMIVATNPGLVSLGELAIIALGASLLANLLWLPAFLYWRRPRKAMEPT